MLLSNFKKSLFKAAAIVFLSLVLFLAQQFFLSFLGSINLPLIAVIFFSLRKSPQSWPLAALSGWLLDASLGTGFFYLAVFASVVFLISYFTQTVVLENYLARWLLIIGSLFVSLLVSYLIIFLAALTKLDFYQSLISLSLAGIISYLVVNSLIIFLLILLAQKLTRQPYARFS